MGERRSSWRSAPLPANWPRIRRRILARDNYRCYRCGSDANEVDHIIPTSRDGTDDESNLAAICSQCHRRKSAAETNPSAPRRRPPEQHPGATPGGAPLRGPRKPGGVARENPDTWGDGRG